MDRRSDRPRLRIREVFETNRLGPQCLAQAYASLVPIRHKPVRTAGEVSPQRTARPGRKRGGEHV